MEEREQLDKALETLKQFVCRLSVQAGQGMEYGEQLWQGISRSAGLLQELAYYHDYGRFLCRHEAAGYTLADVLVWQVDHFKLLYGQAGGDEPLQAAQTAACCV